MLLSDATDEYLRYIRYQKGYSVRTVITYTTWLHHFHRWLGQIGFAQPTTEQLNTGIFRRYLEYLTDTRKQKPKTIHSSFQPLRGLCVHLVDTRQMEVDPATPFRLPKKNAPYRKMVTDEEVELILNACDRLPTAREAAFARAVFSVLAFAALRRAELCDLKVEDFSASDGSLTVQCGKGGKRRKVYPNAMCIEAVSEWLTMRGECDHESLFTWNRKWRMGFGALDGMFLRVKAIAGLRHERHITPHAFRHGCATRLLLNGGNLLDIRDHLGHSNIETTAKYLHSDEMSLRGLAEFGALRTGRRG